MTNFWCWLLGHRFMRGAEIRMIYNDDGISTHVECFRCGALATLRKWVHDGGRAAK